MTVRHWPLAGVSEQFYSGGFDNEQEDLRKLLRQIARWMEHEKRKDLVVEAVTIFPHAYPDDNITGLIDDQNADEPVSWAAVVHMVQQ